MTFGIIGLGGRGYTYAKYIKEYGREIAAVCDPDERKRERALELGVPEDKIFTSEDEFFAAGKLCDALVIATLDSLHYRQAMKALEIGYDILLEKPIAMTLSECEEINELSKRLGRRVVICHVLRYAPIFVKIKELVMSGEIGDPVCLDLTENIGYYHYAHSFCRGNWRNSKISTPLIVAKNCHDTDLILWLMGKKCKSVSSIGSLYYFKRENAPEGCAERCMECKFVDNCVYSAPKIYTNEEYERAARLAEHGMLGFSSEEIADNLSRADNLYGRCVYFCDNDMADSEIVNINFEDGSIAQLKTIAFTNSLHREIKIYGTRGMLYFDPEDNTVVTELLGGEKTVHAIDKNKEGGGHSGGDRGITESFINYIESDEMTIGLSEISESIDGYRVAFLAEESRIAGGELRKIN